MTDADVIAIIFGSLGVLVSVLGCTWHLSGKLSRMSVVIDMHVKSDDERFLHAEARTNELFRWISSLAKSTLGAIPALGLDYNSQKD